MKRFIVRLVMIAAWITGAGFTYQALHDETYPVLYWSVPVALLGLAYFVLNIVRAQRRHNLNKMI